MITLFKEAFPEAKVSRLVTNKELPYPCLVEYGDPEGEHYVVLALAPGPSRDIFAGVILESNMSEEEFKVGTYDTHFTLDFFDTSLGFHFYNDSLRIRNAEKY